MLSMSGDAPPCIQKKRRLDEACCELAPEHSRKVIQGFILAGKVFVNDEKVTKAGQQVGLSAISKYCKTNSFTSRSAQWVSTDECAC